jgi:hypothetical protein
LCNDLINFVHQTYGHAGVDKCLPILSDEFHIKGLGRKIRKVLSCCDTCQRVKFSTRVCDVEIRSHCPRAPGELLSVDLYGPLPVLRGGMRFIFVCLDVFSKHVRLYPRRTATTKACLRKITQSYIGEVRHPRCILSDHGTQFT